ncbi:nickel pincer cofactor biosynthesis protein LarC [Tychonema sp. LEGE 07199]|uniref:nickel pincer cofactor biosynthesis protein LarC n=1 Tax=unclassified Tychonema TaxID=2642144 RepID=UPI0018801411|nr:MULTISPECIES: nickel pincer cofactor biosynthesis protein LarC [unclassified Tychonema]MBE9123616.1 nickel pincer cofactor biosynthesis protein LarC [Tychonema sp. LEGE 07199]MBE9133001.1 nickel pincer cofactor biosynthesis protein LarC [Tychonema sp. LEGE 07196]
MNKIAYFDCPTGIAGDMCIGALLHAGVPLDYLIEKLNLLGISTEYQLRAQLVHRNTQQATKFYVDIAADWPLKSDNPAADSALDPLENESPTFDNRHHHHHGEEHSHSHGEADAEISHSHHRHLPEIEQIIVSAKLPGRVEAWSLAVFGKLADAEAAVHGIPPSEVHFHEVGATDAIIDIVGTCLGLDWLDIDEFYFSPMPTGGGTVKAAHGRLAVPTPAVMRLWETHRVPVYSNGIDRELCTPTGTAIACTFAAAFGPPPPMQLRAIGLGAGSRNLAIPNILRLWIGEKEGTSASFVTDLTDVTDVNYKTKVRGKKSENYQLTISNSEETICVLETQIDDLSPQAIGYVFDALFAAGALDVFTAPIVMKKSRLGVLLTAICHPEFEEACEAAIFRETTTLGIRRSTQQRTILDREIQKVTTEYGEVQIKVAKSGQTIVNVQPEYEDCAEIARVKNVSWREVHRLALQSWYYRT